MRRAFAFLASLFFVSTTQASPFGPSHSRWTELNIGPFYVDTDSDPAAAREALTQLEQLRWVLGGLLESKDLPSLWPFRVLLTSSAPGASSEFALVNDQYLLVCAPGTRMPLGQVAGLFLAANTPRLPAEVESGLRQLFATLEAKGSHVTWGGAPTHPDLAWARMQLFATKFDYSSSFHIFLTALQGTTVRAAEQNAFGKDAATLEQEVAANLASHNWQPVSVSGRPLDPKRDLGEHTLDETTVNVYLADAQLHSNPKQAESAFQNAVNAGGDVRALGDEGLAVLTEINHEDPKSLFDNAIHAGSRSAFVYVMAADGTQPNEALPLLKRAAKLNPLWAEPIYRQAQLSSDPAQKEALLKQAAKLDPRNTKYWIELAQFQTSRGEATAAQASWLRAEDSAPDETERSRIHQQRLDSEEERLNAAEDARRREREAAHLDDEHAQQAEADRIRAAEEKANGASNAAADDAPPDHPVAWSDVVPHKNFTGSLVRVDCMGSSSRLTVKDRSGAALQLLLPDASTLSVACGAQQPAVRVSLTYAAQPDERFHTAGSILSLHVQ